MLQFWVVFQFTFTSSFWPSIFAACGLSSRLFAHFTLTVLKSEQLETAGEEFGARVNLKACFQSIVHFVDVPAGVSAAGAGSIEHFAPLWLLLPLLLLETCTETPIILLGHISVYYHYYKTTSTTLGPTHADTVKAVSSSFLFDASERTRDGDDDDDDGKTVSERCFPRANRFNQLGDKRRESRRFSVQGFEARTKSMPRS